MLGLRDYQVAAHDAILREWGFAPWWDGDRPTSRSTIANLATSSGKTVIAAHLTNTLVNRLQKRVLFIGDREELILQPVEKFHKACGIRAAIHRGSQNASAHAEVVVGSIQTLARRLPSGRPFDVIIDDEAHRSTEQRAKIHEAYPEAKILGITATAFRKNMADLSKWYKTVAFELGTFSLIGEGYITPIQVLTLPLKVDLTRVHQKNGDYDQTEVSDILEPYYEAVADAIKEHAPRRQILAFLPLIKSSQDFAAVMRREGLTARHCDGSSEDRAQIIEQFENKEFQILCNSQVFSTGIDFIHCDCMLNLAATRSRGEYRQRAGRIMRIIPGTIDPDGVTLPTAELRRAAIAASEKKTALILDVLWQTEKIGLAGPASIIAGSEEEEEAMTERIRKKRTPEELEEISREVQQAKEEDLRKALERAAQEVDRKAGLRDAREIMLELHDHAVLNFEPVTHEEARSVTKWQTDKLDRYGFTADSLTCSGQAAKLIDAIEGRQRAGMAPIQAFKALREAGKEHPEAVTLDEAIKTLGARLPCTFGKKYQGVPLCDVPKGYWSWLVSGADAASRNSWVIVREKHPAVFRFVTKRVFPHMAEHAEQQEMKV